MTVFRKQKGRGSPRPLNDPAALPEESQNAVGHLVGLGEHGGAGLLEDLVAQHVGGFHRVVGIHDGAVLGGGIDGLGTQRGGSRREGRHVGTVLGAGGNSRRVFSAVSAVYSSPEAVPPFCTAISRMRCRFS